MSESSHKKVWWFIASVAAAFAAGVYIDDLIRSNSDSVWIKDSQLQDYKKTITDLENRITTIAAELETRNAKVFINPRHKNIRIDRFFEKGTDERNSAKVYCEMQWSGSNVLTFEIDGSPNQTIFSNGQTLNNNAADGFSYIVCTKV